MKQHNLNQVFEDTENFDEPKRLKCVEGDCHLCAYVDNIDGCLNFHCVDFIAIKTTEPITETPIHQILKP